MSLAYFVRIGEACCPLGRLMYNSKISDLRSAGYPAKSSLEELVNNSIVSSSILKTSLPPAHTLLNTLNKALDNACLLYTSTSPRD